MIKVKIVVLGHLPFFVDFKYISRWKSSIFKVVNVSTADITRSPIRRNGQYLAGELNRYIPPKGDADILIAVTNVQLENKHFLNDLSNSSVCVSFADITPILLNDGIPKENFLLRSIYFTCLTYIAGGQNITQGARRLIHEETRGCIFDFNRNYADISYSSNKPEICKACSNKLVNIPEAKFPISPDLMQKVQSELQQIKKDRFTIIMEFIKAHPIYTFIISTIWALALGIAGSICASVIQEMKKR